MKILKTVEGFRERTSQFLAFHDPHHVLRSLILNEGTGAAPLPLLRKLGFVHLVSATGIHLYVIARWCDSLIQSLCFYLNIPVRLGVYLSRITSFLICSMIWLLSGARLGMLRPWIILLVRELALLKGFHWKKGAPLFLALFFDLLIGSSTSSGRWIYALAVGGGLYWCESFRSVHLGLAVGSWITVAFWEAWQTGIVALATPLLSLITLPVICGGIYPLVVIFVLFQEIGWTQLATQGLSILSSTLSFFLMTLSKLALCTGNIWIVSRASICFGILFSCFILALRPQLKKEMKWIFATLLCVIALRNVSPMLDSTFRPQSSITPQLQARKVEQLDVGQGDAALVTPTPEKEQGAGLIDTGSFQAVQDHVWMEILAERQISQVSWIALTHLDEDHSGGLLRLARLLNIGCVAAPSAEWQTPRGKKYANTLQSLGVKTRNWSSDCIPYPHLESLPPSPSSSDHRNENMGAVWIPLRSGGFYFSSGDARASEEIRFAAWAENLSKGRSGPRIVKVNHHGSRFSNSKEFLDHLHPTEAWISAGMNNRYGHPHLEVLSRLQAGQIVIRRTDRNGFISSDPPVTQK